MYECERTHGNPTAELTRDRGWDCRATRTAWYMIQNETQRLQSFWRDARPRQGHTMCIPRKRALQDMQLPRKASLGDINLTLRDAHCFAEGLGSEGSSGMLRSIMRRRKTNDRSPDRRTAKRVKTSAPEIRRSFCFGSLSQRHKCCRNDWSIYRQLRCGSERTLLVRFGELGRDEAPLFC